MNDTLNKIKERIGIDWYYGRVKELKEPPFIVYLGNGQDVFEADNTHYFKENTYQVEYYFTMKNEATEQEIESILLEDGWLYEKSEDVYLEEEDVFLIYYYC